MFFNVFVFIKCSVRGGCELRDNLCRAFADLFQSIASAEPHCSTRIYIAEILTEVKLLFYSKKNAALLPQKIFTFLGIRGHQIFTE